MNISYFTILLPKNTAEVLIKITFKEILQRRPPYKEGKSNTKDNIGISGKI